MPGVGFMEMMAETIRLISTEAEPEYVFNELKFLEGLKLHRELPRDVTVQVVQREHAATYEMTASSPLTSKAGGLATRKEYASAFVQVRPKTLEPLNEERFELPFKHETDYATVLEAAKSRRQNVSFGPLFNEAVHASNCSRPSRIRWSERGIETWVPLPSAQLRSAKYPLSRFLLNPAFLDALHQAGAVLAILLTDQVYLPIGARSFIVHEAPNIDANYRVVAKLLAVDELQVTYDMAMVREDGICCVTVENSLFRRISQ
jgi:hypothetical protein